jgi:hypothetical protein
MESDGSRRAQTGLSIMVQQAAYSGVDFKGGGGLVELGVVVRSSG